jgi:hypothetical protein
MKAEICIGQGNIEIFYEITSPHNETVLIGLSAITGDILTERVEKFLLYFAFRSKLMQRIIVSHLLTRGACYTVDLLSHDVQTFHRIYKCGEWSVSYSATYYSVLPGKEDVLFILKTKTRNVCVKKIAVYEVFFGI